MSDPATPTPKANARSLRNNLTTPKSSKNSIQPFETTPLVDGVPVTMERIKAKLNELRACLPSPEKMDKLDEEQMNDLLEEVVMLTEKVVEMVKI